MDKASNLALGCKHGQRGRAAGTVRVNVPARIYQVYGRQLTVEGEAWDLAEKGRASADWHCQRRRVPVIAPCIGLGA